MRDSPGPKRKNYITPGGLRHERRTPIPEEPGTAGGDEGRVVGGRQRRPPRERRLSRRQTAAAPDRFADSIPDETHRRRRSRRSAAPRPRAAAARVFFGATVTYKDAAGHDHVVSIVGIDEVDLNRRYISWMSPLARAMMKSVPGDRVVVRAPTKTEQLEILESVRANPDGPVPSAARRRSGFQAVAGYNPAYDLALDCSSPRWRSSRSAAPPRWLSTGRTGAAPRTTA